jgi:stalled ribosome alternative rescue factor ArfA
MWRVYLKGHGSYERMSKRRERGEETCKGDERRL